MVISVTTDRFFSLISGLEPLIYLPTNVDISGLLLVPEPLPKGGGFTLASLMFTLVKLLVH